MHEAIRDSHQNSAQLSPNQLNPTQLGPARLKPAKLKPAQPISTQPNLLPSYPGHTCPVPKMDRIEECCESVLSTQVSCLPVCLGVVG